MLPPLTRRRLGDAPAGQRQAAQRSSGSRLRNHPNEPVPRRGVHLGLHEGAAGAKIDGSPPPRKTGRRPAGSARPDWDRRDGGISWGPASLLVTRQTARNRMRPAAFEPLALRTEPPRLDPLPAVKWSSGRVRFPQFRPSTAAGRVLGERAMNRLQPTGPLRVGDASMHDRAGRDT